MNVPLTPVRFLRHAVAQFPRNRAVVCGGLRLTYAQFGERAGRLAAALGAMGVGPADRVAFLSTNCHRLLEAYYDVFRDEGPFTPLIQRGLKVLLAHLGFGEDEYDLRLAHEIEVEGARDLQLANLTRALGGSVYISGPNGRNYIRRENFEGLEVLFHDFTWTPYAQVGHDKFFPWMACVDTIFNIGPEATARAMKEGSRYGGE